VILLVAISQFSVLIKVDDGNECPEYSTWNIFSSTRSGLNRYKHVKRFIRLNIRHFRFLRHPGIDHFFVVFLSSVLSASISIAVANQNRYHCVGSSPASIESGPNSQ
jgi:hypothetical protein